VSETAPRPRPRRQQRTRRTTSSLTTCASLWYPPRSQNKLKAQETPLSPYRHR